MERFDWEMVEKGFDTSRGFIRKNEGERLVTVGSQAIGHVKKKSNGSWSAYHQASGNASHGHAGVDAAMSAVHDMANKHSGTQMARAGNFRGRAPVGNGFQGIAKSVQENKMQNLALLTKGHIGFKELAAKLAHRHGVHNANALAAWIGRRKYGASRMASAAANGKPITKAYDINAKRAGSTEIRYSEQPKPESYEGSHIGFTSAVVDHDAGSKVIDHGFSHNASGVHKDGFASRSAARTALFAHHRSYVKSSGITKSLCRFSWPEGEELEKGYSRGAPCHNYKTVDHDENNSSVTYDGKRVAGVTGPTKAEPEGWSLEHPSFGGRMYGFMSKNHAANAARNIHNTYMKTPAYKKSAK